MNNETILCEDMVLAMAYVKNQEFGELYPLEEGFRSGTIFPELNKPFKEGYMK